MTKFNERQTAALEKLQRNREASGKAVVFNPEDVNLTETEVIEMQPEKVNGSNDVVIGTIFPEFQGRRYIYGSINDLKDFTVTKLTLDDIGDDFSLDKHLKKVLN